MCLGRGSVSSSIKLQPQWRAKQILSRFHPSFLLLTEVSHPPGCPGGAGHGVQVDRVADGQVALPREAEDGQHRDVECPDTEFQSFSENSFSLLLTFLRSMPSVCRQPRPGSRGTGASTGTGRMSLLKRINIFILCWKEVVGRVGVIHHWVNFTRVFLRFRKAACFATCWNLSVEWGSHHH